MLFSKSDPFCVYLRCLFAVSLRIRFCELFTLRGAADPTIGCRGKTKGGEKEGKKEGKTGERGRKEGRKKDGRKEGQNEGGEGQ